MPIPQGPIGPSTPMGGQLVPGGATFRLWAPRALAVYICGDFNGWAHDDGSLMVRNENGHWTGFGAGATDGQHYKFWVVGEGSTGYKRDPYARELTAEWPNPACILRAPDAYPWNDGGWRPPEFRDLVIYQIHIGTWSGPDMPGRVGRFLDVLGRLEYLVDLGINAIEPLPIIEYSTPRSMGYNGSDLFSPEMDYCVAPGEVDAYLPLINRLLAQKGCPELSSQVLSPGINQLKAVIDLCHLYGIAVILDVVYNHASDDVREQPESIYFLDRVAGADRNSSLYFTDRTHTGPIFAFWNPSVRQFLIDNATYYVDEYHIDGIRYDQVSVIDQENAGSGWMFCQDLTASVRSRDASLINIAEYWGPDPAVVRSVSEDGADFDACWHNGLRIAIRSLVEQASHGASAHFEWEGLVNQLRAADLRDAWRAVQCLESHDEVYRGRNRRIPSLAVNGSSTRTWYATSRARVVTALLMTAPGIPMLFMGQEFFEDKSWSDDPLNSPETGLYWGGLETDRTMADFHRFCRDLIWLRRREPALRNESVAVLMADNFQRVLVVHRWIEGMGRDVVVVASLSESTKYNFQIPMPSGGTWLEALNSDVYEEWVNPSAQGNGGSIQANGPGMNWMPSSASITIPANSVVVFFRAT